MTRHVRVRPRRRVAAGALVGALALLVVGVPPAAAYPPPGTTERVSVASDGSEADDWSFSPALSADGRYVVFESQASNLVPDDTNECQDPFGDSISCADIFARDRVTGITERVSVAGDGTEGNDGSFRPSISADGRQVAFYSVATNLVPDDTNNVADVFVHDRETGSTERVSVASDGSEGDGNSWGPVMSADGRYVAFESYASNLVPDDTNGAADVFVHDRQTGITERVSVAPDGAEGDRSSLRPVISADGRYVAFWSYASNLVPGDTNDVADVFVHDRETGITERVSVASDGTQGNGHSHDAAISADGRHVAFWSHADNLVPGDANDYRDVFVHDRETRITERVSVASDGTEGNNGSSITSIPALSADGRFVAFHSLASNLVPNDTNGRVDIFLHDRETGGTQRVSVASDGAEASADSHSSAISADGSHVAFRSLAPNLVPGDGNGVGDIFVRNVGPDVGIGGLATQKAGSDLAVSGWAAFSGVALASAEDPDDDGVDPVGAEIVGASIVFRPEHEDLLLRLRLASLPQHVNTGRVCTPTGCENVHSGAGDPGVLYGLAFELEGTGYEVRARAGATASPPTAGPHFALYECDLVCTETTPLSGGIGTTGAQVRVAVPLEALGVEEGAALTNIEAWAALGEAAPGPLVVLDDVALPDASIPVSRVELGIAPPSAPQADVAFSTQADLLEGRFSATLDASSLPPGAHRVWARACLGETCGAEWVAVAL